MHKQLDSNDLSVIYHCLNPLLDKIQGTLITEYLFQVTRHRVIS